MRQIVVSECQTSGIPAKGEKQATKRNNAEVFAWKKISHEKRFNNKTREEKRLPALSSPAPLELMKWQRALT
jgi:c-di-GMP-binding flagellar brake protein YcgR